MECFLLRIFRTMLSHVGAFCTNSVGHCRCSAQQILQGNSEQAMERFLGFLPHFIQKQKHFDWAFPLRLILRGFVPAFLVQFSWALQNVQVPLVVLSTPFNYSTFPHIHLHKQQSCHSLCRFTFNICS